MFKLIEVFTIAYRKGYNNIHEDLLIIDFYNANNVIDKRKYRYVFNPVFKYIMTVGNNVIFPEYANSSVGK